MQPFGSPQFQRSAASMLSFALLLVTSAAGRKAASWSDDSPHKSRFVMANGIRLHYLDWGGSGPTLILIHGFAMNPHFFDYFAPSLTDRFHVIAYARRGHGQSEAKGPYDSATLTQDLCGLMDALKIRRAHLAGHSMGGNEITAMARLHPDRVDRIVYLDGAYDWADPAFVAAYKAVPPIYLNPPASVMSSLDALRTYQTKVWWPGLDASRLEACRRGLVVVQRDGTLRAVMSDAVMQAVSTTLFTWQRDYKGVRCPVLAIYSETNLDVHRVDAAQAVANLGWERKYMAPFRAASVERVRRELPHAEIMKVAGTHADFLFTSQPTVVEAMRSFLDGALSPDSLGH